MADSVEHSNIIAYVSYGTRCIYAKNLEEALDVCSSLSKSAFNYAVFFLLLWFENTFRQMDVSLLEGDSL